MADPNPAPWQREGALGAAPTRIEAGWLPGEFCRPPSEAADYRAAMGIARDAEFRDAQGLEADAELDGSSRPGGHWADAFMRLVTEGNDALDPTLQRTGYRGERNQVVLHHDVDPDGTLGPGQLHLDEVIPDTVARFLACDAQVRVAAVPGGRAARHHAGRAGAITGAASGDRATRPGLRAPDCAAGAAGCTSTTSSSGADGGLTVPSNLVCLCTSTTGSCTKACSRSKATPRPATCGSSTLEGDRSNHPTSARPSPWPRRAHSVDQPSAVAWQPVRSTWNSTAPAHVGSGSPTPGSGTLPEVDGSWLPWRTWSSPQAGSALDAVGRGTHEPIRRSRRLAPQPRHGPQHRHPRRSTALGPRPEPMPSTTGRVAPIGLDDRARGWRLPATLAAPSADTSPALRSPHRRSASTRRARPAARRRAAPPSASASRLIGSTPIERRRLHRADRPIDVLVASTPITPPAVERGSVEEAAVAGGGAAVHRPLGAGDVAGLVGREERRPRRRSPRARPKRPSGRFLAQAVSFGSWPGAAHHRRVDAAGVHGVHPDAVLAELEGAGLRQAPHRPLARRSRRRPSGCPRCRCWTRC